MAPHSKAAGATAPDVTDCGAGRQNQPWDSFFSIAALLPHGFVASGAWRYFTTAKGTTNCVFSHISLIMPPPDGFLSIAIVN